MFAIIGVIVVIASVVGGYVLEHGNLSLLFQPVELLIIGGAAMGAFLISSTPRVFGLVLKGLLTVLSPKSQSKEKYLELLSLLFQLFSKIRKEGLVSIESDIERPETSPIFRKSPSVLANRHMLSFICDNLKVIITANIPPHELDNLMDIEIDAHHHEALIPSHSISKVADGLPALGIVAAVLGVVLTMAKINEPPAVLGASIGAALVGTFLGVLLSYGFVGPIATNLESQAEENAVPLQVVKVALVAFVGGSAPQMAVEFGRRAIPEKGKPTFDELEKTVRGKAK
ncbi:MAG: flagellar motor stator protein MotA [Nitrospirae bacterium]|nr:flagellar motor stator protein MotA [Nitrospirota bacterium]NTW65155.1 flagellar motor stator protein MotA [Nitrospirota bacterium]